MKLLIFMGILSSMPIETVYGQTADEDVLKTLYKTQATLEEMTNKIDKLNATMKLMARQQILSQLYIEERTRSEGHSGLKQIRNTREGTRPYHGTSHTGGSHAAIHDHANNIRTVGMGEVVAVLNGVEFRTRHNDFRLVMPSTTSQGLHEVEDIPFPDVPPEVLSKQTVDEQIMEMREWFKAWQKQSVRLRDYRKYFKPVICYMEGAWTYSGEQVDESFFSDRHQIDAKNWFELEEQLRFGSYSGAKQSQENIPYLPKAIMNITSENVPVFGQWNYRILCHPLKDDLKLSRLRVVDDLKARLIHDSTKTEFPFSKSARFSLNIANRNKFEDKTGFNKLLEDFMRGIPGKNNYPGSLKDYGYDGLAKEVATGREVDLEAAYYHSRYAVIKDASGHQKRSRGFSDQNLFMALTNHSQIAGMDNILCYNGKMDCPTQEHINQKWSYAIPLEIIYLTPLSKWNPYEIVQKGSCSKGDGKSVKSGGRKGTVDKPFNGSCYQNYFLTPTEFFSMGEFNQDPADTAPEGTVYVLDKNGSKRGVRPSGTRIILPSIEGVGQLRQRYPIAPVHGEGSGVWKELEALQDIVLSPSQYSHMYNEQPNEISGGHQPDPLGDVLMKTGSTAVPSLHYHTFTLTENQRATLNNGESVTVETDQAEGHTHSLKLVLDDDGCTTDQYMYRYAKCDGKDKCWDSHPVCVFVDQ